MTNNENPVGGNDIEEEDAVGSDAIDEDDDLEPSSSGSQMDNDDAETEEDTASGGPA
jgi:hypothetical protein